jgi:hypothetical protein
MRLDGLVAGEHFYRGERPTHGSPQWSPRFRRSAESSKGPPGPSRGHRRSDRRGRTVAGPGSSGSLTRLPRSASRPPSGPEHEASPGSRVPAGRGTPIAFLEAAHEGPGCRWSLTARAGEDAIAGTGSHGRGGLQHPHPATRARSRPRAMIKAASPQVTPPDRRLCRRPGAFPGSVGAPAARRSAGCSSGCRCAAGSRLSA